LTHDPATDRFMPYGQETATGEKIEVEAIRANGTLAKWLAGTGRLLVKEEAWLNPEIARHFEPGEGELERLNASLIAPLTIEHRLVGIVLLGEKLSGEIFDDQELEVLMVLANQTAISLENARLYEELGASNARLTQANRLKSQFLASMSHELRTPLNSIIGFSKVLLNRLNGDLTEQQETYIRSVHTCSVHLLQLINDILNISRIESGKVEMNLEEIALHDLVEECVQSSLPLVRGRSLKIEKEIPPELPRLRGDPTKLRQVLLNLLSNAIKFTAAGRVLVRVQAEPDRIHVSVADTGIGIQAEDLPRLFEPFQRLENPLARQAGGTGLGLAISKKFIDMHGGRIWAESREKQGSTFHFTLPFMERVG
jgi:signal transduction histidine kinase